MALPYSPGGGGNGFVSPRGGVDYDPMSPITSPMRLPTDYPSPPPSGGWQGPVSPGGTGPGPGDFGGFGGFDSILPLLGAFAGGGGAGDFRPDMAFGGGGMDPRQRLRLGMPRQPFSGGGGEMRVGGGGMGGGGRMAAPMMMGGPMGRGLLNPNALPTPQPPWRPGGGTPGMSPGYGGFNPGGGSMVPGGGRTAQPGMGPGGPVGPLGPHPGTGGQQGGNPNDWIMQGGPWATIQELLKYGFLGPGSSGKPGFGGIFSTEPSSEIMGGVRQRAVQDAGAQERASRLAIQSRGDMDPSTYGFQALQSQLQGQQGVQNQLGQADLALRQQQSENYWKLLQSLLGAYGGIEGAKYGQPKGGSGIGGILQGAGSLLGGLPFP